MAFAASSTLPFSRRIPSIRARSFRPSRRVRSMNPRASSLVT